MYKIRTPSEVFAFDISADGNHYGMSLNDCSLVLRSKLLEENKDAEMLAGVEEKIMAQFIPKLVSTAKNYKYFNRG